MILAIGLDIGAKVLSLVQRLILTPWEGGCWYFEVLLGE